MQLDIVIPLYKSKESLSALISRLNEFYSARKADFSAHVIFVDDGSADGTFEYLKSLEAQFQFSYEAIRLVRNFGQHSAIAVGLNHSQSDFIVVMDDDLQHDPFEIDLLFNKMRESGADLVYGAYLEKKHHVVRNISSKILKRITKSKEVDFKDVTSFKLMRKSVLSSIKQVQSKVILVDVYLLECASKVETCEVTHAKRLVGESSYSKLKLIKMSLSILLFHSTFPLKLMVQVGIYISLVCFGLGAYYIYQKIFHNVPIGYTSIIVAIFLSTGLILISLGIIGEYIRRIWVHQNSLDRVLIAEHSK